MSRWGSLSKSVPRSTSDTPAELLQEWITLHRRAITAPVTPTEPTPAAPVVPDPDPALPERDVSAAWLPSPLTLTYVSLPLAVLVGFGILITLFGIGATRHFKRIRSKY